MTRAIASLAELGFVARTRASCRRPAGAGVGLTRRRRLDPGRAAGQPGVAQAAAGPTRRRRPQDAAGGRRSDLGDRRRKRVSAQVIDVGDPADPRLDDFRDLNSVDRRPDLPSGKGLVIAEGVLVVQRMLASRFIPRALLGTDRRLGELAADLRPDRRAVLPGERRGDGGRGGVSPQPWCAGGGGPPTGADRRAKCSTAPARSQYSRASTTTRTSARSSATPPASEWTRSYSAAGAPTRCIGVRCGCRWAMRCWCRMRGRPAVAERAEGVAGLWFSTAGHDTRPGGEHVGRRDGGLSRRSGWRF